MKEWIRKKYHFPDIHGQRGLILGLGGGSDIISAYAVQFLFPNYKKAQIIYGNTKRSLDADLIPVRESICRLPEKVGDLTEGESFMGSTLIDQSIPKGFKHCPYIFRCSASSLRSLPDEIVSLGFDFILGVDTGGDALIDNAMSGEGGRDKMMVEVLKRTGLEFQVILLGPGSDGESTYYDFEDTVKRFIKSNRYLGCFSLEPLLPRIRDFAQNLSEYRTPNIILSAWKDNLEKNKYGWVYVPRGIRPAIPKEVLLRGFVFDLAP